MIRAVLLAVALVACGPASSPAPASPAATAGAAAASPAAATPAATPAAPAPGASGTPALMVLSSCRAPATPTTASTEGPYFKAGSPQRASLVTAGMAGTRIQLVGLVLTRSCVPVANAKVDVWQADAGGSYDNSGYTLRGHVFTDAQGKYQIETIVPARYAGRTSHIHVKVVPPGGPELTTQLYMPNEAANATDGIFRPELTMQIAQSPLSGSFVFIVDKP